LGRIAFRAKEQLWTTGMILGAAASIAVQSYLLPPPGSFIIYGIRDHVMRDYTLDDLRRFAQDMHQETPNFNISHGNTSGLSPNQRAAFQKLAGKYSFLKWGIAKGDGPTIEGSDDSVYMEWGGPLYGHWGFSVGLLNGRNDPQPDPDLRILRVSDDIYFYHGE
jgi:hypothetical protein